MITHVGVAGVKISLPWIRLRHGTGAARLAHPRFDRILFQSIAYHTFRTSFFPILGM
jgi:hypothetical protein